jgi:PAS domain S-box-containing protein
MQNKPRKSNENNFMALLNFIVDPAVIVGEKGRFLIVNDAFMDLTGLSKKELIGTAFLDVSLLTAESKAILLKNLMKRMQGLPVEPYEIDFKDTGTGMSEEALSKLKGGVPLFTTKAKGMGFGLPICRRIVEAHGGKLSVKSKAGKGTTVTVTIPVNPEPADEGEEKWIFSESMLSAITAAQRAP